MFERFTERARSVLADAGALARELKSPAIRRHHLLIALIDAADEGSSSVAAVLEDAGVGPAALRGVLLESLQSSENALAEESGKVPFTMESKKALELSLREALSLGHNYIGREHLLLGVLRDPEGPLAAALSSTKLTHSRAREIVAQESPPSPGGRVRRGRNRDIAEIVRRRLGGRSSPALASVLRRAYDRASDRDATTGDLLVALLETPGTHFAQALATVSLPDAATVAAEVERLCAAAAPDGTEGTVRVDESGAVTFDDPRITEAIKRLAGEGAVTREQLIKILRRLQD